VERKPHRASLLRQRLEHCLPDPPHRIRDELDAAIRIELADRAEQSFVADRNQVAELEAVALVSLNECDHESQVCGDEAINRLLVTGTSASSQFSFLLDIGDHRQVADVVEVLLERFACRCGSGTFYPATGPS